MTRPKEVPPVTPITAGRVRWLVDHGTATQAEYREICELALRDLALSREAEGPQDALADRLDSWAQNEEMIDQHYTAHGRDCIAAAAKLRALASSAAGAQETPRVMKARCFQCGTPSFGKFCSDQCAAAFGEPVSRPETEERS